MHGLIFETSIWLLAGSTRLLQHCWADCNHTASHQINGNFDAELSRCTMQIHKVTTMHATLHFRRSTNPTTYYVDVDVTISKNTNTIEELTLDAPASSQSHFAMHNHLWPFSKNLNAAEKPCVQELLKLRHTTMM